MNLLIGRMPSQPGVPTASWCVAVLDTLEAMWRRLSFAVLVLAAVSGALLAALLLLSPETLVSPRVVTRVEIREKVVERSVTATPTAPTPAASPTATATPARQPGALGIE